MIFVLFIFLLVFALVVGVITSFMIRADVLKHVEGTLEQYELKLITPQDARKKLTELKKKMIVPQHKEEVQDYINLIRD